MTRKLSLSENTVKSMRRDYVPYVFGIKRLSIKYGVPMSTVRDCVKYWTYKHVREWEQTDE